MTPTTVRLIWPVFLLFCAVMILDLSIVLAQAQGEPPLAKTVAGAPDKVAVVEPSDQPSATALRRNPRLFDLMFFNAGTRIDGWYATSQAIFETGGLMTNDSYVATQRVAKITTRCEETLRILGETSPHAEKTLMGSNPDAHPRRLIACQIASSTDPTLRSGDFDTVGDFGLLREEPNSEFGGVRSDAPKLDGVKVYIFLDRVCKDGDVPADLAAHLVHDIGGYLFANAEYFLNSDPTVKVKKAETKAVDAAGRDLMKSIGESIEVNKGYVEVMASRNRPYFEEWAKRN